MAGRVADRCVQVLGGRGYMRENPVERLYRDLRVDRIWEGTNEIQRMLIVNELRKRGPGARHRLAGVSGRMRPSVEEERREQLIAAAARVIARSGYDAATVRDVAREAGVSTGVIAYYFEGKDDLFAHVLRAASRAFRARLESARDAAETPRSGCSRWPRRPRRPMTRPHARTRCGSTSGRAPRATPSSPA